MRTTFKSGDWLAICDVCGFRSHASKLKERWDGLMVCSSDWETRHPQDLLQVKTDKITPPWTRPEQEEVFIDVPYIS